MGNADGKKPKKRPKNHIPVGEPSDTPVADLPPLPPKRRKGRTPQDPERMIKVRANMWKLTALTDKHIYFCRRFVLNGGNSAKAARESDFNVAYATNNLMHDPLIKAEIERYRAERAQKFNVTADRIIAELVKVAFSSLGDYVRIAKDGTPIIDCSDVGEEELSALSEIQQDIYYERTGAAEDDAEPVKKTKIKLHPKLQALEQLGRIFKMFGDSSITDTDTPEQKAAKLQALVRSMKVQEGL